MNWGNRINRYREELYALRSQGWLSDSEFEQGYKSKTDKGFQKYISIGLQNKSLAKVRAQRQAALQRTGGLTRPGKSPSSAYYERYLGITKEQATRFNRVPITVRDSRFKEGKGMVDRYKAVVPDLENYILQKWYSEYDTDWYKNHLRDRTSWDRQKDAVKKYVDAVKGYYKNIEAQKASAVLRTTPALQTRTQKTPRAQFGESALMSFNLSNSGVGKSVVGSARQGSFLSTTNKMEQMLGNKSVQQRTQRASPVRGSIQRHQVKAGSAKKAAVMRTVKAKPVAGVRVKW